MKYANTSPRLVPFRLRCRPLLGFVTNVMPERCPSPGHCPQNNRYDYSRTVFGMQKTRGEARSGVLALEVGLFAWDVR